MSKDDIARIMSDGKWHTFADLIRSTGLSRQSIVTNVRRMGKEVKKRHITTKRGSKVVLKLVRR